MAGLEEDRATPMDIAIIDLGRFAFLEFDNEGAAPDTPAVSGTHVLQILPVSIACRATHFPPLDPALQVFPSAC